MTKMTLTQMLAGLNDLTGEELLLLNKQLVQLANAKSRMNRMENAAAVVGKFQIGDVITFVKSGRGRTAGRHYFIFKNLNRNGDCMQGPPCGPDGKPILTEITKWTIALTQPTVTVHMRNGRLM